MDSILLKKRILRAYPYRPMRGCCKISLEAEFIGIVSYGGAPTVISGGDTHSVLQMEPWASMDEWRFDEERDCSSGSRIGHAHIP
jgi:hypothetical protein